MDNTQNQVTLSLSKKEARQLIYNKLTSALGEFRPLIKKKKFNANMLKATKLFASNLSLGPKTNGKPKKQKKKDSDKKSVEVQPVTT